MNTKKRSFIEDIKALEANRKTLRKFSKEKYIDENGTANIDVYPDELYSKLSGGEDINGEIVDYIESQAYFIPTEYPLNIRLHGVKEEEREKFTKKIKEHYWIRLADTKDDLRRNGIISLVLLLVGIALYLAYFLVLIAFENQPIFNEILSVSATFSVWEAVDYFMINRSALRIKQLHIAQLALLKTSYVD